MAMVTYENRQNINHKTLSLIEDLLLNQGYLKMELAQLVGVEKDELDDYIQRYYSLESAPHWAADLLSIFGQ